MGDTGAGTSSIIEAITYALYGQATFSGLNRELMNDAAGQLRVVLRFRARGMHCRPVAGRPCRHTAAGSRVERLTDAQRRRLGEAEAGSSALSGLLD